jgi:hypothetical protein
MEPYLHSNINLHGTRTTLLSLLPEIIHSEDKAQLWTVMKILLNVRIPANGTDFSGQLGFASRNLAH